MLRDRRSCRVVVLAAALAAAGMSAQAKDDPAEELIKAAKKGQAERVRLLLGQGVNINSRDKSLRTAVLHAAREGHEPVIRLLIEKKADLNLPDEDGNTALMEAAKRDDPQPALELIAAGADATPQDKDGWTALMEACKHGTMPVARELIKKKGNLDAITKDGRSALSLACERGTAPVVQALIDGSKVSVRQPEIGGRAMMIAAAGGQLEIVRALMDAKAPLELAGGGTALHAAASNGRAGIVDVLLAARMDPGAPDGAGETPLMRAAASSSSGTPAVINMLVDAGAKVDQRNGRGGKTALIIAAEKGNDGAVEALLKNDAERDLKYNGRSALDIAVAGNHKRCIELLGGVRKAELRKR